MKVEMVKLKDMREEFNPRADFSKVDEIMKSIDEVGLLHPIVVKKNGEGFVIVDGAQRFRALKKLGQSETQAVVVDAKFADVAQMDANLMRSDLTFIERARGYARLIEKNKARFSAATISKVYGEKKKSVEAMLDFARLWDPKLDGRLSAILETLDNGDLEILTQVPKEHQGRLIEAMEKKKCSASIGLDSAFFKLEMSDVFRTEQAASAKGGFKIKRQWGGAQQYTADKAVYEKAKEAYEAERKKRYGRETAEQEKRQKKEAAAKKVQQAKRRAGKDDAKARLKAVVAKFLSAPPSEKELVDLGERICGLNLNANAAKALFEALGAKDPGGDSWEVTRRVFKGALLPLAKDANGVVRLFTLLSAYQKYGEKSFEQQIVERAEKK